MFDRIKNIITGFCLFGGLSLLGFIAGGILRGLLQLEGFLICWVVWGVFSLIGWVRFIEIATKGMDGAPDG